MKYLFIEETDQHETIVKAMMSREQEHHNYEINRINYEHMLKSMANLGDWPEELIRFKNVFGEKLVEMVPSKDLDLVHKLQFRDRIKVLLATTILEQSKCEAVYNSLCKQLPEGEKRTNAIIKVKSIKKE